MKATGADSAQRITGVKKFSVGELIYKNIGLHGNGYLIDCFKDGVLLMTYHGFYNHRTGDYTLYPHVAHKYDPRIPGKHVVHITKVN